MPNLLNIVLSTISKETLSEFGMEIRVRQVLDFAKQAPMQAVGNLGNGAVLAWVFWDRLSHLAIVTWLCIFVFFSCDALFRWWVKRTWPAPARASRRALIKVTLSSFGAGMLWAAAVLYAFPQSQIATGGFAAPETMALQLLLIFLVGGLSAGAVASMAAQPLACLAFLAPPLISILMLLMLQQGYIAHAMCVMLGFYIGAILLALFSGFSSFVDIVNVKISSRSLETRLLEIGLAESTRSNQAKSQFLANMSHELRTPLNAVIGFSEIIRDQTLGPVAMDQYRDYADHIHQAGSHLLRIINDVLDVSKIEAGKLELYEGEVSIRPVIDGAITQINQAALDASVTIMVELPVYLPPLLADERRLKQIFLNLLSNAVKFSNRCSSVIIGGALRQDGQLRLWVADTGVGMSEAEVATAAEPFHQAESGFSRLHSGTGLGLSLVEGFMKLHGGRIEIDSTPSVGTTVTMIFPPERVLSAS